MNRKASSTLEYIILFSAIIATLIVVVRRGAQNAASQAVNKIRDAGQAIYNNRSE